MTGVLMQKFLPNDIKESPLVDKSSVTNFMMTITYKF